MNFVHNFSEKGQKTVNYRQINHLMIHLFIIFLTFSIGQTESVAYLVINATSTKSTTIIGSLTGVISMTINGTQQKNPISEMDMTKGVIYNITVTYHSPLPNCDQTFKDSKCMYLDISQLDTSQCKSFSYMFSGCSSLTSIKIGENFITSKAEDMSYMFSSFGVDKCKHNFNFSNFSTSKVKTMQGMFSGSCFKFLNLTSFDTSQVTTMQNMFSSYKVISLDLSSFDNSKVNNVGQMFASCNKLVSLDISNFNLKSGTYVNQLFFSMSASNLKFCPKKNTQTYEVIKAKITEGSLTIKCNDPCFTNEVNKFNGFTCVESCQTTSKKFEYENQCNTKCPSGTEEIPVGSYFCVDVLDCSSSFYNYDKTECIDKVPEGFYCNDEEKKTIDKCQEKCKLCELQSVNLDLCVECNGEKAFFIAEDYSTNENNYVECFSEAPEGYYFDLTMFKKCYESCKNCNERGDSTNHKCTECKNNMITELGSNCYEKCSGGEYYYFDDSNEYHCTELCPTDYKLISPKNKCIKDCRNDVLYIYEYEGECLDESHEKFHAPNADKVCILALHCDNYYNYDYTGCETVVPEGFFCNDTTARTIDKCQTKCQTCTLESFNNNMCTACNYIGGYFLKEDDILNTDDQVQCYNTVIEGYFLDRENNIYKKCYKSCKNCDSLGNIRENL